MSFPTLAGESIDVTLQFALLLRDGFADSDQLLGTVSVTAGSIQGQPNRDGNAFLFYNLKTGPQSFSISSGPDTPYYLAKAINLNITSPMPSPLWPAYPDITKADPTLPLGDPNQPAIYKTQRLNATLLPSNSYPFPSGSTLIRGTVTHGGIFLAGATVQQTGGTDPAYVTGADGQFVLFLKSPPSLPNKVTVTAKSAGLPDGQTDVTVLRGLSVSTTIAM